MNRKIKDNLFAAAITAFVIAIVVLANVVLYSLTAINGWYFAYAEKIDLTVSGNTKELFAEAERQGRKVNIIFCMPRDELALHSTGRDVLETAEQIEKLHPDFIDVRFYNIRTKQDDKGNLYKYDDRGNLCYKEVDGKTEPMTVFETYEKDMLGNENVLHRGSVIFSSTAYDAAGNSREDYIVLSNQYSGVPFVDFYHIDAEGYITAYIGEEVIASMVLWTLAAEHKTAYFTTGHGETVDVAFIGMLSRAGYYVQEIDLLRPDKNSDGVPDYNLAEAGIVVISNPTSDFAKGGEGSGIDTELERLETYLSAHGGALYVSLDPYADPLPNLEGLLSGYGITVAESENGDGELMRHIIKDASNAITTDGYTFVANYADNEIGKALSEKTDRYVSDDVVVKNSGELSLSGAAKPVLVTSSSADALVDGKTVESSEQFCVAAYSERAAGEGTARVFVTAGVYLTASDAVISDAYANRSFTYALFENLLGAPTAPYGCRTVPYSTDRLEDLTMGTARLYTILIMAIPAAIAAVGFVINKRRKNR